MATLSSSHVTLCRVVLSDGTIARDLASRDFAEAFTGCWNRLEPDLPASIVEVSVTVQEGGAR